MPDGSRKSLGKMDGEDVLNGLLKVPGFEVLHNEKLLDGERVTLVIDVQVDAKKGINHKVKDSTLTRIHNVGLYRVAVVEDDELQDRLIEFWMNRPDDVGTQPMQFPDDDQSDEAIVDDMADDGIVDADLVEVDLEDAPALSAVPDEEE